MRNLLANCRNNNSFATVLGIALSYAPFILAMQYSKHKWVIVRPDSLWGYAPLLHAEMSLYLLVVASLLLFVRSTCWAYLVLTMYYVVCFFDSIAWFTFSRPFHPEDIMRGIELLTYYSELVTQATFSWKRIVYMAVPFMIGTAALASGWKSGQRIIRDRVPLVPKYAGRFHNLILTGASVAVVGYAGLMPLVISRSYLHYNSLFRIGEEIYDEQLLAQAKMHPADRQRLFGAPADKNDNVRANRYNVIVYILETAPKAFYPEMSPFFRQWAERNGGSLRIMEQHYTTYPESDRSFLSIMSGNYPCLSRGSTWIQSYDYGKPLPQVLEQNGYKTLLFSTAPLGFHNNDVMVKRMGFSNAFDSPTIKRIYQSGNKSALNRTIFYEADQKLLEQAMDSIIAQDKQPYMLTFMPQASHAPFQKPPDYTGGKSQLALFDANARWQMELLNKLLRHLEDTGQAQKTILMVVGDHGLRHPAESSLFQSQTMLSPLTFGVAFACYCPQQMPPMRQAVTSHIDITPTILEMLGIRYDPEDYQGRSMLTSTSRTVFFLGGDYLPVSGFTRDGYYFMENRNRNLILKRPLFDFHHATATHIGAVKDKDERASISRDLSLLKSLLLF